MVELYRRVAGNVTNQNHGKGRGDRWLATSLATAYTIQTLIIFLFSFSSFSSSSSSSCSSFFSATTVRYRPWQPRLPSSIGSCLARWSSRPRSPWSAYLLICYLTTLPKVPVHNKSIFHFPICVSFCFLVHSRWFHSSNKPESWNCRYQYFFTEVGPSSPYPKPPTWKTKATLFVWKLHRNL